jgi:2-oxoglutarate ferredoxin oxidoreductase subunit alpha
MTADTFSFILSGSGGAGAISTGSMLLEAASRAGWYAYMTRSVGAQIRGGEAVAMVRVGARPIDGHGDHFDLLVALDWKNLDKFAPDLPLTADGIVVGESEQGDPPPELLAGGARFIGVPLKSLAQGIPRGRPNMVAMGLIARLLGLPDDIVADVLKRTFGHKGEAVLAAGKAALQAGADAAAAVPALRQPLPPPSATAGAPRWIITGNQAAGLGAIRGGVRYVAAYPITPATEILEWMAPALGKVGGRLVQVEDELAAVNHIIGASFGGVPALTATAGPGLALMTESLGLAVASETPIVVVDVQRGGPSTGIPAKSEQSDLNIAIHGLHGDAPHVVVAPNSVADCIATTQWAVHLAETLQVPAIVLSDQALGQAQAALDRPADAVFATRRLGPAGAAGDGQPYRRYALTASGVSPMAVPGMAGGQYTADGLEHAESGTPSSLAADHRAQLAKRRRKLTGYDYGGRWADIEGEGPVAVLTWGSCTGAAREAAARVRAQGRAVRVISLRLLAPLCADTLAIALEDVERLVVVEQSEGAQFHHYLRAHLSLPARTVSLARPGPVPIRPGEIEALLSDGRST